MEIMRGTVGIVALILANMAFAGCLAAAPEGSGDQAPGDGSGQDPAAGTEASGNEMPDPPVAVFTVEVAGNLTELENGTIPVPAGSNVTFNATLSSGTGIRFGWDFDDNTTLGLVPDASADSSSQANGSGEAEAAEGLMVVEHAFAVPGQYNVTLYVTDVADQVSAFTLVLNVSRSGPPSGTWLRDDSQSFGTVGYSTYLANGGCGPKLSQPWVIVDQEANGTASTISKLTATVSGVSYNLNFGGTNKIWFLAPDGKVIKENTASGISAKTITVNGPLPPGTYKVEAQVCASTVLLTSGSGQSSVSGKATYVVP